MDAVLVTGTHRAAGVAPEQRALAPLRRGYRLRVGVLEWAVGAYCGLVGGLTFVTPHQFSGPAYALLRPCLPWWGLLCLLGGGALFAVALLAPRRSLVILAHLLAAVPILLLGLSAAAAGGWTALCVYGVLGLGTAAAPLIASRDPRPSVHGDLFAVLVGLAAILNGLIMLLFPAHYGSVIFDPVRPYLPLYGTGFLIGGAGVVVTQVWGAAPSPLRWGAHIVLGAALFAFGPPVSWPNRAFTSFAYYNGFGLLVALLPWLRARLRRADPRSLRARLALAFGLAVSLPLVVTVALVTNQIEQAARADALTRTQVLATTLARGVGNYVGLHRAAVEALAAQPDLLTGGPERQREVLRAFHSTYPDALGFALYDADGRSVVYGDPLPVADVRADRPAVVRDVERTGQTAVRVVTTSLEQPIFAIGAPIRTDDGRQAGTATVLLEAHRLADVIDRTTVDPGDHALLVDEAGHVITDAGGPNDGIAAQTDISDWPTVMAFRGDSDSGALSFPDPRGERLAGYARIQDLDWGVVVERPAALALAAARFGRDLAFAILLVIIVIAASLGIVAADRLAAPLEGLARAVDALTIGAAPTALPRSGISEVAHLASVFGDLRTRLIERTAEREQAEQHLRFLADASSQLARSLDYEATLEQVARLAVPMLADWCLVDLAEDEGAIRRVDVAHADPGLTDAAARLREYPPDSHAVEGIARVLRTGESELTPLFDPSHLGGMTRDARHRALVRSLDVRSVMRVPLVARGRVFGVLTFLSTRPGRRYGPSELALAEDLGRRCGVAVDNARLYAQSQEAIRARDEFLSIASHELRTPLAAIKGYAQNLQRAQVRGRLDDERLRRALQAMDDATNRLVTLVSDLLDVSRIRTGQLPLRIEPLNLTAAITSLAERYEQQLGDHHTLVVETPDRPSWVDADAGRLEQIVTNLLENAVKYSPGGGTIRLTLENGPGGALLQIRDDGIGLPADSLESIFQPFGRAANATQRSLPGMGLGLHICRTLVERHGGRVWAVSDGEDRGTTFGIWLPPAQRIPTLETVHA
ncbi:MAG: GAF domain-containing protein [Chloroflexi bacterium]|nr:GAF domain-containing protein [Chloroflexota bacterium]